MTESREQRPVLTMSLEELAVMKRGLDWLKSTWTAHGMERELKTLEGMRRRVNGLAKAWGV
jgi:hypothetical protein